MKTKKQKKINEKLKVTFSHNNQTKRHKQNLKHKKYKIVTICLYFCTKNVICNNIIIERFSKINFVSLPSEKKLNSL